MLIWTGLDHGNCNPLMIPYLPPLMQGSFSCVPVVLLFWVFKLQSLIALSEAEYIVLSSAVCEVY